MAGGKQSPRDKMIGMMYLVLTALLALQVSNSVLEKFIFINQAFETTNKENVSENVKKVESIQKAVGDAGNREKDLAVLDKAKKVREATKAIIEELDVYKEELIQRTGGVDENGNYLGQKDIDAPSAMFVNEKKGDELKDNLNEYSSFLREVTGDDAIKNIAKDANEISVFKDDPNQNKKGFAELNFGHSTPMVGALASLSQLQSDVIVEETKALATLAREVGAEDLKFDQIVPMVRPESRVVAAGSEYVADMFIAASSSAVNPAMTYDGNEVEVIDGMGKVKFTARASSYDKNGMSLQSFIGAIKVKLPGGRDTTFTDTIEYIVSKPVIQIQSASVQALYLNCGNELTVNVPALGTAYNPTFGTKGGQSIKGANRGDVTIVPKSANVTLSVSSGGNLIGTESFKVKRIPKPEITVYSGGREVDLKRGTKGAPRSIKIQAVPDESFAQFLPKDAKFRVAESEITLVRSGRAVQSLRPKGPDVNLSSLASQARPGDALVIEVKKVQRRNFKGEVEDFPNFGPRILTVRIN
ncbi:gliding motility protein GldM [Reichenbachiella agariperforans]|uniref:type IX secretion system motor protein PorM/GldM n=1 Tax=Reichenbachiella agariperforans TaxID=156994 RepID=UPI001C0A0C65|nr:gliding motility protein GldM [Reichenbachiella agariperforans]MBU2914774.1 gliding motility protein GldM [Reichenbachiella agariperforans]